MVKFEKKMKKMRLLTFDVSDLGRFGVKRISFSSTTCMPKENLQNLYKFFQNTSTVQIDGGI
jgi:tRNA splicing ligase